jgi:hypothetical protein
LQSCVRVPEAMYRAADLIEAGDGCLPTQLPPLDVRFPTQ